MEKPEKNDIVGNLVISEEVIASIALNAVRDVEGVGSFSVKPTRVFSMFPPGTESHKSVRVIANDNDIRIFLYLNLKNGAKIPAVCEAVQRSVKGAVQSMTGRVVTEVNISVTGLDVKQPD